MTDPATHTLLGFAQPVVAPLDAPAAEIPTTSGPAPMPELAAPTTATPLAALVPQPAEHRDPSLPLVEIDPLTESQPAWTPDQPLMDVTPTVDPALLPPPTGAPVIPTQTQGWPQTPAPQWPVSASAGGGGGTPPQPGWATDRPMSAPPGSPSAMPAPVGWPGNQPAPRPGQSVGQAPAPGGSGTAGARRGKPADAALILILLAFLFPTWSSVHLSLAGIILLRHRTPGRMVTVGSAVVAGYLTFQWWLGYVPTSSLESSARILALVTAAAIGLLRLQARRA